MSYTKYGIKVPLDLHSPSLAVNSDNPREFSLRDPSIGASSQGRYVELRIFDPKRKKILPIKEITTDFTNLRLGGQVNLLTLFKRLINRELSTRVATPASLVNRPLENYLWFENSKNSHRRMKRRIHLKDSTVYSDAVERVIQLQKSFGLKAQPNPEFGIKKGVPRLVCVDSQSNVVDLERFPKLKSAVRTLREIQKAIKNNLKFIHKGLKNDAFRATFGDPQAYFKAEQKKVLSRYQTEKGIRSPQFVFDPVEDDSLIRDKITSYKGGLKKPFNFAKSKLNEDSPQRKSDSRLETVSRSRGIPQRLSEEVVDENHLLYNPKLKTLLKGKALEESIDYFQFPISENLFRKWFLEEELLDLHDPDKDRLYIELMHYALRLIPQGGFTYHAIAKLAKAGGMLTSLNKGPRSLPSEPLKDVLSGNIFNEILPLLLFQEYFKSVSNYDVHRNNSGLTDFPAFNLGIPNWYPERMIKPALNPFWKKSFDHPFEDKVQWVTRSPYVAYQALAFLHKYALRNPSLRGTLFKLGLNTLPKVLVHLNYETFVYVVRLATFFGMVRVSPTVWVWSSERDSSGILPYVLSKKPDLGIAECLMPKQNPESWP